MFGQFFYLYMFCVQNVRRKKIMWKKWFNICSKWSLARDINYLITVMVPKMPENSAHLISRVSSKAVWKFQCRPWVIPRWYSVNKSCKIRSRLCFISSWKCTSFLTLDPGLSAIRGCLPTFIKWWFRKWTRRLNLQRQEQINIEKIFIFMMISSEK